MSEEVAVLSARFAALEVRVEDRFEAWGRELADQNSALKGLREQLSDVTRQLNKVAVEMAKSTAEHQRLWSAHFGDKQALETHVKNHKGELETHLADHREGRIEKSNRGNVVIQGVFAVLAGSLGAIIAWLLKP